MTTKRTTSSGRLPAGDARPARPAAAGSRPERTLRLGLPAGSLQEATFAFFRQAGWRITAAARSYYPTSDDPELDLVLMRPQEMSRYIEAGKLDAGITGQDWLAENGSDVKVCCDLRYNKATSRPARWVLAVPETSPIRGVKDLAGKRIATELVGCVKRWLKGHGVAAEVEFSWGATEVKVPDLVDAIVDITETGSSLRANGLRIVETIVESYPVLIANHDAFRDAWKRAKLEQLAIMFQGALAAQGKVGLKMNIPQAKLAGLLQKLPALRNPTVSPLADPEWCAVETILDEQLVRELIPRLKAAGAEGIVEYPLSKIIP